MKNIRYKQMKKTGIAMVTVVAIAIALSCLLPALAQAKPDLTITEINAYHYDTSCSPWFNLLNEVDVTVENKGDEEAEASNVCLYARVKDDEEYELIGNISVPSLSAGASETVTFENWKPIGNDCLEDCTFTDTSKEYELKAVADCDNNVNESESGEENNDDFIPEEPTVVCYNGYTGDEPLKNVAHNTDTFHGGLIFTTGDGEYGGLYSVGDTIDTIYEITLPAGASVELARLNVYYTWHYEKDSFPAMEVSIDGTVVELDASYNDIKCQCPGAAWVFPWGNYVYDITDCISGSGTYTVTVKRTGGPSFCIAAPGIVLVYEDKDAPMIEYWINEGADIIIGGRRPDGGFLSLEECKNTATFDGEHMDLEVEKAIVGVVSPWGGGAWHGHRGNVLYFNDEELGEGVYCGYHDPCTKEEEGISMSVGIEDETCEAQVGIAAFDVTDELEDEENVIIQGDDGDCMMPTNAFLVITYEEEEGEEEEEEEEGGASGHPNITAWNPNEAVVNNTECESRTFNITVNQTVDISWLINGTEVQTNECITEAAYTNTSAVVGIWNVSAIATNSTTELSDMHTWIWVVTSIPTATPTSTENITTTPTPAATPTSTVNVTPTPASTPASKSEEKKKPEAEAPVPGFELAISLSMSIAVAYLIRKRGERRG